MLTSPPKYPSTPHWPWSEKVHRDDTYHSNPEWFLDKEVIITEKVDGGNTLLWKGEVYARSVLMPASDGWFAMVKKHHAWKPSVCGLEDNIAIYGEDIYGIHSIEYDPIKENRTYYIFSMRQDNLFFNWDTIQDIATLIDIPTVPILYRGIFSSVSDITKWFREELKKPSILGPHKEGFVMRTVEQFPLEEFRLNVCKYVRANHVQTDQHWRKNWQPCKMI